jgi:hypothetical protein
MSFRLETRLAVSGFETLAPDDHAHPVRLSARRRGVVKLIAWRATTHSDGVKFSATPLMQ